MALSHHWVHLQHFSQVIPDKAAVSMSGLFAQVRPTDLRVLDLVDEATRMRVRGERIRRGRGGRRVVSVGASPPKESAACGGVRGINNNDVTGYKQRGINNGVQTTTGGVQTTGYTSIV